MLHNAENVSSGHFCRSWFCWWQSCMWAGEFSER